MQNTTAKVTLIPFTYKEQMCIGIHFPYENALQRSVRRTRNIRWSQSNKCWYIPLNKQAYEDLLKKVTAFAAVDNSALKQYLHSLKNVNTRTTASSSAKQPRTGNKYLKNNAGINIVNSRVLPAMYQTLILKAYSPQTIKTYLAEMSQFLQALKATSADSFATKRIKDYLQYCLEQLKLSENTLHSRINALKFYYEQVLGREKFFWEIPRPKKPILLPKCKLPLF